MARVDDYINAKKIAAVELGKEPCDEIGRKPGFGLIDMNTLRIPFLDRVYIARWPGFEFIDESQREREVPIQEQVLVLHYLMAKPSITSAGKWVSFREIPGASFYFSAFVKRAVDPLKKTFGKEFSGFVKAAGRLKGKAIDAGDAGFEFMVFPRVSIRLIIWKGDEEFSPEANILFSDTIGDILSPEDVAWLAGMLVYRLMALAR
jgi:Domain of unknown function (DUF3786)